MNTEEGGTSFAVGWRMIIDRIAKLITAGSKLTCRMIIR
jgi:hypothetical protein